MLCRRKVYPTIGAEPTKMVAVLYSIFLYVLGFGLCVAAVPSCVY